MHHVTAYGKMVGRLLIFLLGFLLLIVSGGIRGDSLPQQVHLSATETPSSMLVSWVTFAPTSGSLVKYGLKGKSLTSSASGNMTKFEDDSVVRFMHVVEVKGLQPGAAYDYQCGYGSDWSKVFTMYVLKDGTDWSPRFAVFGDMGLVNGISIPFLINETSSRNWDIVLHTGDIAYDLHDAGDDFMNAVEAMATQIPYMVCPGNHEWHHNFTHYRHRFNMPGDHDGYYYSWNIGPVHLISFSTELYFYLEQGIHLVKYQYEWLENDLKLATSPEQRAKHPWIITMAHRPMYCTNPDGDTCNWKESRVRTGLPIIHSYPLEKLFYKYGVDLELWGHEHDYERLWPVYDLKVYNGSYDAPYVNPKAPVHFISGAPGNKEFLGDLTKTFPPWIAVTNGKDYSYSKMTAINGTHLLWEQISATQGGKVIDSVMIVKDKHGPEAWL